MEKYNGVKIRKYGITFELDYEDVSELYKNEIYEYVKYSVLNNIRRIDEDIEDLYYIEIEDCTTVFLDFDENVNYLTVKCLCEEISKNKLVNDPRIILYFEDECIMSGYDDFDEKLITESEDVLIDYIKDNLVNFMNFCKEGINQIKAHDEDLVNLKEEE